MKSEIILSCRIDYLIDPLLERLKPDPMAVQTILVPNGLVGQWLSLEIAKRKGVAMGLKIVELGQLLPSPVSSFQMFSMVYDALRHAVDAQVMAYVDGRGKRLLDLSEQLSQLFFKYGRFGFDKAPEGWQGDLFRKLFVEGSCRLQAAPVEEAVFCFGVDFLPPMYWQAIQPEAVFLFSPCAQFWEDSCTDRERRQLHRYWKKKGATKAKRDQLDLFLREAPRNLANWGKLGRETLKGFEIDPEEAYPSLAVDSQLTEMQASFLAFEEPEKRAYDGSVQIVQAGSSKLEELECVRSEILKLQTSYAEVSVMAPEIEAYVPLIELVFKDMPYRIYGMDVEEKSSFRQGFVRLLKFLHGRWDVEEFLPLLETKAFYQKQKWDQEAIETIKEWLHSVRWGVDLQAQQEGLEEVFGPRTFQKRGSWEQGLDRVLDQLVFLRQKSVDADLFEQFLDLIAAFKKISLKEEKTGEEWAEALEKIAAQFLILDPEDPLSLLELCTSQVKVPFGVIERFLYRPRFGQIHGSHLHAIRFASLKEAAQIPAETIFLIGMSEESFPKVKNNSSLDLLPNVEPEPDRYLFLEALFAAKKQLYIVYQHLSSEEGKPVFPSIVVQELMGSVDVKPKVHEAVCRSPSALPQLAWPNALVQKEIEPTTISIRELNGVLRHPWKFFLQKVHGIYLESDEESFVLQKYCIAAGEEVDLPAPLLEAIALDEAWQKEKELAQLQQWGLKPISIVLEESCKEPFWDQETYFAPALQVGPVRIVGNIERASLRGLISGQADLIGGSLKVWAEALIVAVLFDVSSIWVVKNKKERLIQDPKGALQGLIDYYFATLHAPSPLVPQWIDSLLRRGEMEFCEAVEEVHFGKDPTLEWVRARSEPFDAATIFAEWAPFLKKSFASLIAAYPTKGQPHAEV